MHMPRRPFQISSVVLANWNQDLEADIQCAVTSDGGVLIIGPAAEAEAITARIHRLGGRSREPLTVADCGDPDCLRSLEARAGGTVLLRDVDLLRADLQQKVLAWISDRRSRVIASSRRSPIGTLDPRLFYLLNMVSITVAPPSPWPT
jgi:hypothetical protein